MGEDAPVIGFSVSSGWSGHRAWSDSSASCRRKRRDSVRRNGAIRRMAFVDGGLNLPDFVKRALSRDKREESREQDLGGADEWLDMAADLGPLEPEKPKRDEPQWEYPEGVSKQDFKEDPESGWGDWQKALREEADQTNDGSGSRDPKQETDFWRGAVKDVLGDTQQGQMSAAAPSEEETQSSLWQQAREVTKDVKSMEDKLRDEVDSFDLQNTKDSYRSAASEVTPESVKAQSASTRVPEAESEQDPGLPERAGVVEPDVQARDETSSGEPSMAEWNPDRDWKRYDDIRRDEALALEAERRRKTTPPPPVSKAPEPNLPEFEFTDDDGNSLSREEIEAAAEEGAVFIDENGQEVSFSELLGVIPKEPIEDEESSKDELPEAPTSEASPVENTGSENDFPAPSELPVEPTQPTLPRRPVSNSMYGSSWSGFDDAVQEMVEAGENMRDPKADAEFWRGAAQELSLPDNSLVADSDVLEPIVEETEVARNEVGVNDELSSDQTAQDSAHMLSSESSEDASPDGETPLVDNMWMSAAEELTANVDYVANEEQEKFVYPVGAMDAKLESSASWTDETSSTTQGSSAVLGPADDLWKSAASDVVSGVEFVENEQTDNVIYPAEDVKLSTEEQKEAWGEWSSASAAWSKDLENAEERDPVKEVDMWRNSARELVPDSSAPDTTNSSDWGSGMSGKTSDRSAWDSWNAVQGTGSEENSNTSKQSLWWASRADGVQQNRPGSVSDAAEPQFWGDMARSMSNAEPQESAAEPKSIDGKGEAVDFWKEHSKDVLPADGTAKDQPANDANS